MELHALLESRPRCLSLPVAAASGMAFAFYPGADFLLLAFLTASAAAGFGLALGGFRARAARLRGTQALVFAFGLMAGASIAWAEAGTFTPRQSGPVDARRALRPTWVEGRLSTDSSPAKNGFRSYVLVVERLGLSGRGISAELSYPKVRRGGSLRILSRAGAEIDSGSFVRASGSYSEGTAASGAALFARPRNILVVDRGSRIDRARNSAREACRRALGRVGKESSGLLQALILGVRDSLAPEESEVFKAAGCSHILALSGEHLSVLAVLAVTALRPFLGPLRARLGGAVAASLFMWIAGPGPSLLRSVLMVWIGAVALALDRPQSWLGSLALAFLVMAPLDPAGARSLSFTLSFLAVLGLALLGPRFSFLLGRALPPFLREPASASLAAQAAVSPLLALSFGYLQFAGIFASMAAGPIVIATMWWGMGSAFLCSILPFVTPFAIPVSDFLYRILMGIMRTAASCPVLSLPSLASAVLASLAVVGLAALVYARPYAEYRAWKARLRFPPSPASPPRGRGLSHVQALRPELPGQ
jgi:competence protein ComEC